MITLKDGAFSLEQKRPEIKTKLLIVIPKRQN